MKPESKKSEYLRALKNMYPIFFFDEKCVLIHCNYPLLEGSNDDTKKYIDSVTEGKSELSYIPETFYEFINKLHPVYINRIGRCVEKDIRINTDVLATVLFANEDQFENSLKLSDESIKFGHESVYLLINPDIDEANICNNLCDCLNWKLSCCGKYHAHTSPEMTDSYKKAILSSIGVTDTRSIIQLAIQLAAPQPAVHTTAHTAPSSFPAQPIPSSFPAQPAVHTAPSSFPTQPIPSSFTAQPAVHTAPSSFPAPRIVAVAKNHFPTPIEDPYGEDRVNRAELFNQFSDNLVKIYKKSGKYFPLEIGYDDVVRIKKVECKYGKLCKLIKNKACTFFHSEEPRNLGNCAYRNYLTCGLGENCERLASNGCDYFHRGYDDNIGNIRYEAIKGNI